MDNSVYEKMLDWAREVINDDDLPSSGEVWFSEFLARDETGWSVNDRWKVPFSSSEALAQHVASRASVMVETYEMDSSAPSFDGREFSIESYPVAELIF